MKRCPECRRDYYDDTLLYCLDDGSALLEGPARLSEPPAAAGGSAVVPAADNAEPATAILSGLASPVPGEPATRPLIAADGTGVVNSNSIAVLPFANMSNDPENEFFCDGLAEELLNALTRIESLKVAARTSAFSFKGTNKKVSEIGRALGVDKVLEGSVRKSGNRVRIMVQVVSASDGYHLWSERYDREMNDIFAVQDEITLAVVEALKIKLLHGERSAILKKATDNAEAYQLYLRGRAFWNRRTPADFQKAIENFEKATSIDPDYSLAYAGIADCYTLLTYFEEFAPHELREKTRSNAERALELDEGSADAHTSMALYGLIFEFDLAAAERHFQRAVELDPRSVTAQYLYGTHLATRQRFGEASRRGQIALELDPLSQPLAGNIARVLYFMGRYDEAIELSERYLELAPNFFFTHWAAGVSYRQKGDIDKAIYHLQKAVSLSGMILLKGDLGVAFAMAGREDEARGLLAELEAESKLRYVSPQWPAVIYAALGEIGTSLQYLEKAWEVRAVQLLWLDIDPNFAPLRSEPRFIEILNKSGMAVAGGN
jgi:adenylate cyclase